MIEDTVKWITVPQRLNRETVDWFSEELAEVEQDPMIRVLALQGREAVFCTGLDIQWAANRDNQRDVEVAAEKFAGIIRRLLFLPKPIVAEIDGTVIAGGVGISSCADMVVATEQSRFALPELLYGIVPAIIMPALLCRMSVQKVRMFSMMGHSIEAGKAREFGLVDMVVGEDSLRDAVVGAVRHFSPMESNALAQLKAHTAWAASLNVDLMLSEGVSLTLSLLKQRLFVGQH